MENIILKLLHVVLAIGVIVGVLMQSGKSAGLSGAVGGGAAESFFGKKKGLEEKLSRVTTFVAILFMVSSIILAFIVS